jgi:CHAD domain-containing protein
MTTSHVEIERKYDLGADGIPDLASAAGVAAVSAPVEQILDATYYDTPDLRLAAARITLRRRTGGDDAGWHLKVPSGADREERHLPLTADSDVPDELVGLVRVHVRDQQLIPVATVHSRRAVRRLLDDADRVLAEVADDRVTAQALQNGGVEQVWRELEVELSAGDRGLLKAVDAVLRTAGATPSASSSKLARVLGGSSDWTAARDRRNGSRATAGGQQAKKPTAGEVVTAHLREQVTQLKARDPQARQDAPDGVHKMRVATRRLRSAMATFRPLLDRTVTDPVRGELKWLAGVLGEPRDAEVMRAQLLTLIEEEPDDLVLGPVRRRVELEMDRRHREAHERAVRELDSPRYFRLLDALDALAARPPLTPRAGNPATKVLPALVRKAWRRLDRQLRAASGVTEPAARDPLLHEARKDAKRARYAAESVEPVFGRAAQRLARRLTALQETLGEHQDSVVLRQTLRQLGVQAHLSGENGFTFGRLHALEQARAEGAEHRYPGLWRKARAKKAQRWLAR